MGTSATLDPPPAPSPTPPQPPPAKSRPVPIRPGIDWHRLRKRVHLACFVIFVALPFFDVMRFDIPRARFYFAGYELWISEFGTLFFALMFLMFLVAAASMLYGRVYCGYLCPQMIFSEASTSLEAWLKKAVNRRVIQWPAARRKLLTAVLFYSALLVASVFLSFVFIAYFVEPRDLLHRLARLDITTWAGLSGASTTLVTFLDFAFVRQRFCTTVCPYGYLQGMLSDRSTLLVMYDDPNGACIECRKCVRVCEMGIDIRKSPHQMECVHCGECIDACADVLGRLGQRTLIDYRWGARGPAATATEPWFRRIGLRDAKRVAVLFVLLFYASGLAVALSARHPVLVSIDPDRARLYEIDDAGRIVNRFRVTLANRGSQVADVILSAEGLKSATLAGMGAQVRLQAGMSLTTSLEIRVAPGDIAPGVSHFTIVSRVQPEGTTERFPMTFIAPTSGRQP